MYIRKRFHSNIWLVALLGICTLIIAACGGGATPAAPAAATTAADHGSSCASIRCFQRPGRHRGCRGNGGSPVISGSVRHSDHNADGVRY